MLDNDRIREGHLRDDKDELDRLVREGVLISTEHPSLDVQKHFDSYFETHDRIAKKLSQREARDILRKRGLLK